VTRGIAITTVIVAASLFLVVEAFKTSHQNDRRMLSVLLAELNHRVKNNLSIVSSLVTLKDAELADQADLSDLNNQVKAVMKVHETLQESENVSRLPLRPFVDDLLSSVFAHHKDQGIRIRNDVDDVEMDSKRAVVLGLIVTELATNARKYAFDRTENAELRVELKHDAPHRSYVLTVSNNGAPIPEGVCLDNADSLGLQLVSHLVTQLSGSIRMQRAPTPRFVIRFPID
jgi:two-component sensor histidine kinase